MSKRIVDAIIKVLNDNSPETEELSDEQFATKIFKLVDRMLRADLKKELKEEEDAKYDSKYLVVVGQTLFRGHTKPATVALGPFGARANKSASDEGGKLSYDTVSHRMGRFMVVPLFRSAFEANKNFVAEAEEAEEETEPLVQAMAESTWHLSDKPACMCGLKFATHCYRHNKEL